MGRAHEIDDTRSATALRTLAKREKTPRVARRMLAIANGLSRAEAAARAGMERRALRDAVIRYNAEGLEGLRDRPGTGRPPALDEGELALLAARIYRGPDPKTEGVSAWTLPDLCPWIAARFDKQIPPQSLSRILRREGFSRQKMRPTHPKKNADAERRFAKKGCEAR